MTDYNDGKWHGWNGGECPVHPKSLVEAVWHDPRIEEAGMTGPRPAMDEPGPTLAWPHVVKFRVIHAHREPREAWSYGAHLRDTREEAEAFRAAVAASNPGNGYENTQIVHWREVTP